MSRSCLGQYCATRLRPADSLYLQITEYAAARRWTKWSVRCRGGWRAVPFCEEKSPARASSSSNWSAQSEAGGPSHAQTTLAHLYGSCVDQPAAKGPHH